MIILNGERVVSVRIIEYVVVMMTVEVAVVFAVVVSTGGDGGYNSQSNKRNKCGLHINQKNAHPT